MKKLVLSLLGAATLAISSNALALDTQAVYSATVSRGFATAIPVGILQFVFWGDIPSNFGTGPLGGPGYCQYVAEWDSFLSTVQAPSGTPLGLSGQILVDELKTVGQFSCPANAQYPTFSSIALDTGPGFYNTGFDTFQQLTPVLLLSLGESGPILEGVVEYGGPVNVVYSIILTAL
jgi:hypothetical protein